MNCAEVFRMGRITTLLEQGAFFDDLGLPTISPDSDRSMVCGSIGLNTDMKAILQAYGLREGANENAGGILHQVSGEIILLQMGCLACPVRLFVLTESGIEARGFVWARSSRCSC